jgi:hypothetical protein
VLAAVHHAADAVDRVAAKDQEAVAAADADRRLYVPVRLLPDKYDIPHPYALAPRQHADALLAAYDTPVEAAARVTAALDDLAVALDAQSGILAAARQAPALAWQEAHCQLEQQPAPQPRIVTPVPGRTEQALLQLETPDPCCCAQQSSTRPPATWSPRRRRRHSAGTPSTMPPARCQPPGRLGRRRRWPARTRPSRHR